MQSLIELQQHTTCLKALIFFHPDYKNELSDSPIRVVSGVLDLLGQRKIITAHAGADCIHASHRGKVEALISYKIHRDSNFKVFIQVLEIVQHVRALCKK